MLLVGQVDRDLLGRDAFQEMDYERVFGSSAKAVLTVDDADRIPELVARAMQVAHSGRPGPVVLVVPEDVQYDRTAAPVRIARARTRAPPLTETDRARPWNGCRQAQRPVLIVGGPGWSPSVGDDVTAFAERNDIPLAAAFRWQDAVDNASPSYAGYLGLGGSRDLAQARDRGRRPHRGARPAARRPDHRRLPARRGGRRTALVSPAPGDLGRPPAPPRRWRSTRAWIRSRPRSATRPAASWPTGRLACPAPRRPGAVPRAGRDDLGLDTAAVVAHLREALPADAIVTNGAGNYAIWLQRFLEFRRFGTQLAPRNGAMGYGVPAGPPRPCTPTGRWSPWPATAAS